ncbi:MAG: hypothetical protein H7255_10895, partial [Ramlibacter sp.]|nr:hypothetical protein [Ramlibacter sp.]
MTSSQAIAWLFARPIAGLLFLALGIALLRAALTGSLTRIPVLERLVAQGVRPKARRKRFLARVEFETLGHLEAAFPAVRVHCQVSMGALIAPERWLGRHDVLWTHRLYAQKFVDYVLQDRCTGE